MQLQEAQSGIKLVTEPHASARASHPQGVGWAAGPGLRGETKHCDTGLISELSAPADFMVHGHLSHFFSSWLTPFLDYGL